MSIEVAIPLCRIKKPERFTKGSANVEWEVAKPFLLSALDLVPMHEGATSGEAIRASLNLAEALDRWGYHRVWYAEHHNFPTVASTTPEILIALAAERTERIRVGAGGVMLPNHAPLKVAETYKMLSALYPGRIDLGIGRAPGTDAATAIALRGSREALGAEDFPKRLQELLQFGDGAVPSPFNPNLRVSAIPEDASLPEITMLGSSEYGAQFAALLGSAYAFAGQFSDLAPEGPMRDYRFRFTPRLRPEPYSILGLTVICAETDAEAEELALSPIASFVRLRTGRPPALLRPEVARFELEDRRVADLAASVRARMVVGGPEAVRARLEELAEATEADEIMVAAMLPDPEARLRSYGLIADAFLTAPGLASRSFRPSSV
jgi:luciferase family oxidoreductase group 1